MAEVKRMSLVKPTLKTHYHIDFDWWRKIDRDWRVYLQEYLCPQHQVIYENVGVEEQFDFIDPNTAEVQRVDALQYVLISHCARQPDFTQGQTTLVDSIFRLFLANGNTPLTAVDMADQLGRQSAETILRTISGIRIYKGIRPTQD